MNKIILIAQGSQSIQLIRELFALGYSPKDLYILTVLDFKNGSFIKFIEYYKIEFDVVNKLNFNDKLLEKLIKEEPGLLISFSNPFILNQKVLEIPKIKYINFHPGYLPNYRGSLSTVYSLINEESFVGGSWHYITQVVDKGPIINRFKIQISARDTAFSLNHKIFSKGILNLELVLNRVEKNYQGIKPSENGKFYKNIFPDLSNIKDPKKNYRILFFPPNFE